MLTGQEIYDQGIVNNVSDVSQSVQQHSIDLRLSKVSRIIGDISAGVVFAGNEKKTTLSHRQPIGLIKIDENSFFWILQPGTYEITFIEGCMIPDNLRAFIVHRSSLFRNGAFINSAIFDAGFSTDSIGTMMVVTEPIKIQSEARIATLFVEHSHTVLNLYSGQFQHDKQRQTTIL